MTALTITRPMPAHGLPTWPGAQWCALVEAEQLRGLQGDDHIVLQDSEDYAWATLLVRHEDTVTKVGPLPIIDGTVPAQSLARATGDCTEPLRPVKRFVSVVVCTRDRTDFLRDALDSIVDLDYEDFEVIVVDNAPATDDTRKLVESDYADRSVRYVLEPAPGLSNARNCALRHARGDVVAFTDDDVVVDPQWLNGLCRGFARSPRVGLVTGLVPAGELRTPVQQYFEDRVSWSKNLRRRVFSVWEPPADLPMFPFCIGEYGTGANFAISRHAWESVGLFDPALGVGTMTRGGEDIDMFYRVVTAGIDLAVEPSAIVWHRHRADIPAMRAQAIGYGRGLGAWLIKAVASPRSLAAALRRMPVAFSALLGKVRSADRKAGEDQSLASKALARQTSGLGWLEFLQVFVGPFAYGWTIWRSRGDSSR